MEERPEKKRTITPTKVAVDELTHQQIILIKAITRSAISVIVVGMMVYLLVTQTSIPDNAWYIILLIIGANYGMDGVLGLIQRKNGKEK